MRRGSASAQEFSTAYCARRLKRIHLHWSKAAGSSCFTRRNQGTAIASPPKNRLDEVSFDKSRRDLAPPEFVLFVNDPQLMTEAYRRYLEARIREAEPYPGLPIILTLRARARDVGRR